MLGLGRNADSTDLASFYTHIFYIIILIIQAAKRTVDLSNPGFANQIPDQALQSPTLWSFSNPYDVP